MDIRVLVFNSGTFNRAELSKMSEQELWQLWEKDEDQAQVQMYYLDEFSCAFNDEEVSDQDWLYFVDYDNVKGDAEEKQIVYAVTKHECWGMTDSTDVLVGIYDSREKARVAMNDYFDTITKEMNIDFDEEWQPSSCCSDPFEKKPQLPPKERVWSEVKRGEDSISVTNEHEGWSCDHIILCVEETEVQ